MATIRKDVLTFMPMNCAWANELMDNVHKTCLSKAPLRGWIPMKVHIVDNPDLEEAFEDRKEAMRKMGRTEDELKEEYCFLAETWKSVVSMCKYGIRCSPKRTHILGDTNVGLHLNRNYDMLLKFMTHRNFLSARCIVVLKVIPGRSKKVMPRFKGRTLLHPSKYYDSHVSMIEANPNIDIAEGLANNFIYVYQFDEKTKKPVSYPRQVVPYAVIQVRQPLRLSINRPFSSFRERFLATMKSRFNSRRHERDRYRSRRSRSRSRSRSRRRSKNRSNSRDRHRSRSNSRGRHRSKSTSRDRRRSTSRDRYRSRSRERSRTLEKADDSNTLKSTIEDIPTLKDANGQPVAQAAITSGPLYIQTKLQKIQEEIKLRQTKLTELRNLKSKQEKEGYPNLEQTIDLSEIDKIETDLKKNDLNFIKSQTQVSDVKELVTQRELSSGASTPTLDEPQYNKTQPLPCLKELDENIEDKSCSDKVRETEQEMTFELKQEQKSDNCLEKDNIDHKKEGEDKPSNKEIINTVLSNANKDEKDPANDSISSEKQTEIKPDNNKIVTEDLDIKTLFREAIYKMNPSDLYELLAAKLEGGEAIDYDQDKASVEDEQADDHDDVEILDLSCKPIKPIDIKKEPIDSDTFLNVSINDIVSISNGAYQSISSGQTCDIKSSVFLDNLDILASVASEIEAAEKNNQVKHGAKGVNVKIESSDPDKIPQKVSKSDSEKPQVVISQKVVTIPLDKNECDAYKFDTSGGEKYHVNTGKSDSVKKKKKQTDGKKGTGLSKELESLVSTSLSPVIAGTKRRTANSVAAALAASETTSSSQIQASKTPPRSVHKQLHKTPDNHESESSKTVEKSPEGESVDKSAYCRENLFDKFMANDDIEKQPKESEKPNSHPITVKKEQEENQSPKIQEETPKNCNMGQVKKEVIDPEYENTNFQNKPPNECNAPTVKQERDNDYLNDISPESSNSTNPVSSQTQETLPVTPKDKENLITHDSVSIVSVKQEPQNEMPKLQSNATDQSIDSCSEKEKQSQNKDKEIEFVNKECVKMEKATDSSIQPNISSVALQNKDIESQHKTHEPKHDQVIRESKVETTSQMSDKPSQGLTEADCQGSIDYKGQSKPLLLDNTCNKIVENQKCEVKNASSKPINKTGDNSNAIAKDMEKSSTLSSNKDEAKGMSLDETIVDIMNNKVAESIAKSDLPLPIFAKRQIDVSKTTVNKEKSPTGKVKTEPVSPKMSNAKKIPPSSLKKRKERNSSNKTSDNDSDVLYKTLKDLEQAIDMVYTHVKTKPSDAKLKNSDDESHNLENKPSKKSEEKKDNGGQNKRILEDGLKDTHSKVNEILNKSGKSDNFQAIKVVTGLGLAKGAFENKSATSTSSGVLKNPEADKVTNKESSSVSKDKPTEKTTDNEDKVDMSRSGSTPDKVPTDLDKTPDKVPTDLDKTPDKVPTDLDKKIAARLLEVKGLMAKPMHVTLTKSSVENPVVDDATRAENVLRAAFNESIKNSDKETMSVDIKKEPVDDCESLKVSNVKGTPAQNVLQKYSIVNTRKDSNSVQMINNKKRYTPERTNPKSLARDENREAYSDRSSEKEKSIGLSRDSNLKPLEAIRNNYLPSKEKDCRKRKVPDTENRPYKALLTKYKRRSDSVSSDSSLSTSNGSPVRERITSPRKVVPKHSKSVDSVSSVENTTTWFVKSKWDSNDSPSWGSRQNYSSSKFIEIKRTVISKQKLSLGGHKYDQDAFFSSSGNDKPITEVDDSPSAAQKVQDTNPDDSPQPSPVKQFAKLRTSYSRSTSKSPIKYSTSKVKTISPKSLKSSTVKYIRSKVKTKAPKSPSPSQVKYINSKGKYSSSKSPPLSPIKNTNLQLKANSPTPPPTSPVRYISSKEKTYIPSTSSQKVKSPSRQELSDEALPRQTIASKTNSRLTRKVKSRIILPSESKVKRERSSSIDRPEDIKRRRIFSSEREVFYDRKENGDSSDKGSYAKYKPYLDANEGKYYSKSRRIRSRSRDSSSSSDRSRSRSKSYRDPPKQSNYTDESYSKYDRYSTSKRDSSSYDDVYNQNCRSRSPEYQRSYNNRYGNSSDLQRYDKDGYTDTYRYDKNSYNDQYEKQTYTESYRYDKEAYTDSNHYDKQVHTDSNRYDRHASTDLRRYDKQSYADSDRYDKPDYRYKSNERENQSANDSHTDSEINDTLSKAMSTLLKKIIFDDKSSDNTKEGRMAKMVLDMVKARVEVEKSDTRTNDEQSGSYRSQSTRDRTRDSDEMRYRSTDRRETSGKTYQPTYSSSSSHEYDTSRRSTSKLSDNSRRGRSRSSEKLPYRSIEGLSSYRSVVTSGTKRPWSKGGLSSREISSNRPLSTKPSSSSASYSVSKRSSYNNETRSYSSRDSRSRERSKSR